MKQRSALFLFIFLSTGTLFSQWSSNPSLNTLACNAAGDQSEIRIIPDGTGGAIITWMDARPAGHTDIYAQRLDASGFPKWTPGGVIICGEASDQSVPALTEDGNGGAIIVWKDLRNGNSDLYAQLINSAGTVQWTPNGIAVETKTGEQIEPKIASDGSGGAIITWQDSASGSWDIYSQRINSSGTKMWSAGGVAVCAAANDQKNPRIEISGPGESIIVWQDKRNGTDYNIYAQKLNANGAPQWAANGVAICTSTDTQNNPKLESDGSGGVLVGWADKRNGNDYDVYAQRLNASGTPQWPANGIIVSAETGNQSAIDISSENISGAIFTWKDYRNNIYSDIYAQYIDLNGTAKWTVNGIPVSTKVFDQLNPNIVTDTSGAIIVWQDSSAGQWDIYAQRILLNGTSPWGTNGKVIGNALNNQVEPKHVNDGKGGAIVAWQDNRDSAAKYDIYAQNINADGTMGSVGMMDLFSTGIRFNVYPNPNEGKFHIMTDGPEKEFFSENSRLNACIYNILGKEILRAPVKEGGSPVSLDISSQPDGIYFYRILEKEKTLQSGKIVKQ